MGRGNTAGVGDTASTNTADPQKVERATKPRTSIPTETVGVLAVQGAFIEHERRLEELGARCIELRQASDLRKPFSRLVLPGGESTVQGKLLRDLGMLDELRQRIAEGMPVLATCAGLILLAECIEGDPTVHLGTLPVTVRRNAYGRQLGSFRTLGQLGGLEGLEGAALRGGSGTLSPTIPMTFIRAPLVTEVRGATQVLARVNGNIVAVRHDNQIATAFHPELDPDTHIHQAFLAL